MIGTSANAFTYIGLDEAIAPAYGETTTALTTESTKTGLARASATCETVTTTVTDDTAQWSHQFTAGVSATITGFGVFNAVTGGNMAMWCTFAAGIPLVADDLLTVTGKIQFKKTTE
jgi:hypothetical protein